MNNAASSHQSPDGQQDNFDEGSPSAMPPIIDGDFSIPSQGDKLPAYLSYPAATSLPLPIAIVLHDRQGLDDAIRHTCQQLAMAGYLAIAPDLFFRQVCPAQFAEKDPLLSELIDEVKDSDVLSDLDHVAHWASQNKGNIHQLVVTGYGWGGRIAWLYAAHTPQLQAAAAWCGPLQQAHSLHHPHDPMDIIDKLIAPVIGLYAGETKSTIDLQSIKNMQVKLQKAHPKSKIVVYPEASDHFYDPHSSAWHPSACEDGWQQMLAFFGYSQNKT